MYDDVDELSKIYNLFVEDIQFFSSDFNKQKEHLKNAVLSDELASDFLETDLQRAKILYDHEWITKEQLNIGLEIEALLRTMNKEKQFWNDEAVAHSPEWQSCRELGRQLLSSLGY